MPRDRFDLAIRPMTADDVPLFEAWLARPHVQQWWGDAQTQVKRVRAKLDGRDSTRPFIFELDGVPAGYTQYSFFDDHKTPDQLAQTPWLDMLPAACVGIDIFLAESNARSKGIGSSVVRMMAERLWADGHRQIIIDPDANNKRAVRAYEKAGFHVVDDLLGKTQDFLIMRFDPEKLTTATARGFHAHP